jgi:hypothetical protein
LVPATVLAVKVPGSATAGEAPAAPAGEAVVGREAAAGEVARAA